MTTICTPTIQLNNKLRSIIKQGLEELKKGIDEDDEQSNNLRLILQGIEQLDDYSRNTMLAYMFICDYSSKELAKLLQVSTQKANIIIKGIKIRLLEYANNANTHA